MDDIERAVHDALTDWSDDDDFFQQWHRFINGPLSKEADQEPIPPRPIMRPHQKR